MEEFKVPVRYIGPRANFYHSHFTGEIVWNFGDVHELPASRAKEVLIFTDTFERADLKPQVVRSTEETDSLQEAAFVAPVPVAEPAVTEPAPEVAIVAGETGGEPEKPEETEEPEEAAEGEAKQRKRRRPF